MDSWALTHLINAVYEEVGFIHIYLKTFGMVIHVVHLEHLKPLFQNPNTFAALYRTILKSANLANQPENLMNISKVISKPNYLNQPEIVVRQTLTGRLQMVWVM
jgi:nitrate/nitrite transport system substrate-binding protein